MVSGSGSGSDAVRSTGCYEACCPASRVQFRARLSGLPPPPSHRGKGCPSDRHVRGRAGGAWPQRGLQKEGRGGRGSERPPTLPSKPAHVGRLAQQVALQGNGQQLLKLHPTPHESPNLQFFLFLGVSHLLSLFSRPPHHCHSSGVTSEIETTLLAGRHTPWAPMDRPEPEPETRHGPHNLSYHGRLGLIFG